MISSHSRRLQAAVPLACLQRVGDHWQAAAVEALTPAAAAVHSGRTIAADRSRTTCSAAASDHVLSTSSSNGEAASSTSTSSSCSTSASLWSAAHNSSSSSSRPCYPGTIIPINAAAAAHLHQASGCRGYAAKAGKAGGKPAPPPAAPPAPEEANPSDSSSTSPPPFKPRRLGKPDALQQLTPEQRKLLSSLLPAGSPPLTSLRQLGWPVSAQGALAVLHDKVGDAVGSPVSITPLLVGDLFQSADFLGDYVAEQLEGGAGWGQIEQFFVKAVNGTPEEERLYNGIRVQIKGPVSGKSGMKASKKVWAWGVTGGSDFSVPVDFARRQAVTKAGLVGIKVLVSYKKEAIGPNAFTTRGKPPLSLQQVLAMPRGRPLVNTTSAWWNIAGPMQPQQHRAWECFREGYDPVAQSWQQDAAPGPAAAAADGPQQA